MLMHKDNIDFAAKVKEWTKDPGNKGKSVAGDDRTPAWTWLQCLYCDAGKVVIDVDNIMAMMRDAGKKISAPTGKGSLKSQTQSGIIVNEIAWPLMVKGKTIDSKKLMALIQEQDFEKHEEAAREAGFSLFVKRAAVNGKKHVRVRPRFEGMSPSGTVGWSASGTITVTNDTLTTPVVQQIFNIAGSACGIGDWRPSSPLAPGPYGRFIPEIKEIA